MPRYCNNECFFYKDIRNGVGSCTLFERLIIQNDTCLNEQEADEKEHFLKGSGVL